MAQQTVGAKWPKFLGNLPFGLFLGASFGLALAWSIDGEVAEGLTKNWTYLFSAMASLLAASIALSGVLYNIENQNAQNERNRAADLRAAKAVLPLALTSLFRVAETCADFAMEDEEFHLDPSNREKVRAQMLLDPAVLITIKDCIRFGDEISAGWLAGIVRKYQICHARHENILTSPIHYYSELSQADLAANWSVLVAMVAHCFDFARGDAQVVAQIDPKMLHMLHGSRFLGYPVYNLASQAMVAYRSKVGNGFVRGLDD